MPGWGAGRSRCVSARAHTRKPAPQPPPLQAFDEVAARTSTVPFQAIWEGRQTLPPDYWREFMRGPYLVLIPFCLGAYWAHPLMQRASYWLGW